jgi:hypothetical protein
MSEANEMKITLQNTDKIVAVESLSGAVTGRIWEGQTDEGIYVQCVITRIAAPSHENLGQFERELEECAPPRQAIAFPLRMVI